MPIDPAVLLGWPFEDVHQAYDARETMLYALAIGFGSDPLDRRDLRYVYEDNLQAFPTFATCLAYPGPWMRDPASGVDWRQMLHAAQSVVIHRPLPAEGRVTGRSRVERVVDRGAGRGALVHVGRDLYDEGTGDLLSSQTATLFCRADGGFGGTPAPPEPRLEAPERAPDATIGVATLPQAALLYRLLGDRNPLHADPAAAAAAGFDRPILHGLCTFGVAARAVSGWAGASLSRFEARFSRPVYPGDALKVEIWRLDCDRVQFRCLDVGSGRVVLGGGLAAFTPAP